MAIFNRKPTTATRKDTKKIISIAVVCMLLQAEVEAAESDENDPLHKTGTIEGYTVLEQLSRVAGLSVGFTLKDLPDNDQRVFFRLCDRAATELMRLSGCDDDHHYMKSMVLAQAFKSIITHTQTNLTEAKKVRTFLSDLVKREKIGYFKERAGRMLAKKIIEWA